MKKLLKIFLVMSLLNAQYSFVKAQQNLVSNPSFEVYSNCPNTTDITYATGWSNPTGYSPDYYNLCAPSSGPGDGFSVPNNWWGSHIAKSGDAYAGIITGCFNGDCREYIQTKLTDTLESGKKYIVSFWVSLGDSTAYAVNDIGIYFSNTAVNSADNFVLNFTPQIENNLQNSLCISNTWINVKDTLIAQGNEVFLTIGNFKNDVNSDSCINNNGAWWNFPYYYIDDVSVTLEDTLAVDENHNDFELIKVFPNPFNNLLEINFNKNISNLEIKIFNVAGDIVYNNKMFYMSNNFQILLTELPSGIYFLHLEFKNIFFNAKLIK